jgi:predicted TIM-barrel fold metal-dependent hydrolase
MRKTDFHVHLTPPDIAANWQKYAEKDAHFALLAQNPRNRFADAEETIRALDETGFDSAVVFGFAFRDAGLCRYVNDYIIDSVRRYPRRLAGFMALAGGAEAARELDRCHDAGLAGVGELYPTDGNFPLDGSAETAAFAAACAERRLPLLLHVNEPVGHYYPGKIDTPLRQIETFIERNGNLRVILAHWGGGLCFYEAMPELRAKFRNVYYDTAATPFLYDKSIYAAASALGLGEKLLFGSDFPLLSQSRYRGAIETSGITAAEQERLLGGNAERLLRKEIL